MSRTRPLPLPPSGISVWRPLDSAEGGLVAIVGSGPSQGEPGSDEDVPCVWCGLRSRPAAACDVCGSPLYETITIWQPTPAEPIEAPPPPVRAQAAPSVSVTRQPDEPQAVSFWPAAASPAPGGPRGPSSAVQPAAAAAAPKPAPVGSPDPQARPAEDGGFRPFRRFAGLEISWIRRPSE